jgi:AraC-like DNA-binding protein
MHTCVSALPCPGLREYVRAFAQREISSSAPDIVRPVPANLDSTLQLDFGNSTIVEYVNGLSEVASSIAIIGPHTYRRCQIRLSGPIQSFGVFFQPLGLWRLFRIPMGLLVNQAYRAEFLLGNGVWSLWQRMAESVTFEERVHLAEKYLLDRVADICTKTQIVSSALHILHCQGGQSVVSLAGHAGLSVRQFERRFSNEIGMSPKLFARIARYQTALDSKLASPGRSWLEIAHNCGYHDQMHMIKDFQILSGYSPGAILLELGDMRPALWMPLLTSGENRGLALQTESLQRFGS